MVGAIGFEPTTPCAQGRCATRLRYAPTCIALLILNHFLEPRDSKLPCGSLRFAAFGSKLCQNCVKNPLIHAGCVLSEVFDRVLFVCHLV
jgi:hypothetical protein